MFILRRVASLINGEGKAGTQSGCVVKSEVCSDDRKVECFHIPAMFTSLPNEHAATSLHNQLLCIAWKAMCGCLSLTAISGSSSSTLVFMFGGLQVFSLFMMKLPGCQVSSEFFTSTSVPSSRLRSRVFARPCRPC